MFVSVALVHVTAAAGIGCLPLLDAAATSPLMLSQDGHGVNRFWRESSSTGEKSVYKKRSGWVPRPGSLRRHELELNSQ